MKMDYFEKYDFDPFKRMLEPKKPTPQNIFIVVLMILAGLLLILQAFSNIFEKDSFYKTFEKDFFENQKNVYQYTARQFSPSLGYLMNFISVGSQDKKMLDQIDRVQQTSEDVFLLFLQAKSEFPYEHYSAENKQKINTFFEILTQINAGRKKYIDEVLECARMVQMGIEGGYDFCIEEQERWQKQSDLLFQNLIASLKLDKKDTDRLKTKMGVK